MSVAVLRLPPERGRTLRRLALALGAVLAVAALASLAAYLLAPPPAAPPPRNPFGTGLRESAPATSGLGSLLLAWQGRFFALLRDSLSAMKADGSAWPALIGLGFAYGIFHAAGPGHGKAVISAYLVANERALGRGLALSAAAALVQALVAIALVAVVFGLLGGTAATMGAVSGSVEATGFAIVAALGAVLVWRKAGRVLDIASPPAEPAAAAACGHLHGPPPPGIGWRAGAAVALGAGIRPCAGALVTLAFARSQGLGAAGIAATFAMAAGTALTTGALASLAVFAKRLALRAAGGRGRFASLFGAGAELAAAAAVLVIGLALLTGSWDAGRA